jgi:hypothetical protein
MTDWRINDETSILKFGAIYDLNLTGITLYNTAPVNSGDKSTLIDLSTISSSVDSIYTITNVNVTKSEVTLVHIDNTYQSKTINQTITVSNVLYQDSYFEFSNDLLVTQNVKSSNVFEVQFSNIIFKNLNFDKGGNLMRLQHQSPNEFLFSDLTITNITYGGISIQMSDKQVSDQVLVKFINVVASAIDAKFRSFIQLNTGANLEVHNSEFYNIGNLRTGAVLNAGNQKAVASLHNCNFYNNTAIEAAVFVAEEESLIEWYKWQFYNNFAIGSGVFKTDRDGYYYIYDSTITNNKALYAAVSEVFSSQFMGKINNSTINNNFALSKSVIQTQILTQSKCSLTF